MKQLGALRPTQELSPAASFEPEQNILAGAQIDALARYWSIYEGRTFQRVADRMAEFLAAHSDAKIWNKCSRVDLLERAVLPGKSSRLLTTDSQAEILKTMLLRVLPEGAAVDARILSWNDDPDFVDLKSNAMLQDAGVPEHFLGDSRCGAILYRYYRCAWVHELDPNSRLRTDEPIPSDLLGIEPPYYMVRNGVRRLHTPTRFVLQSLERAIDSFEQSIPDGASIALE